MAPPRCHIMPLLLISATYDGIRNKAVLKFYDTLQHQIILHYDETEHKPFCYTKPSAHNASILKERDDVLSVQEVKKLDLVTNKWEPFLKINATNPLAVSGTQSTKGIRDMVESWESDIKYYETYLADRGLVVGKYYDIIDGKVMPHDYTLEQDVNDLLHNVLAGEIKGVVDVPEFKEYFAEWAHLLNQPIPKIKRLAVDIEVEATIGNIPDPKVAENKITAVGLAGSDGVKKVMVLRKINGKKNDLPPDVEVIFHDTEKEMLLDAFGIIKQYPVIITYNGDEFDMPFLRNRAEKIGIQEADNPLYVTRDSASLKHGVHIDLYRTCNNRAYQIYVFGHKYSDFSLNSVSKALLGKEKISYGIDIQELDDYQIANYCFNDASLTLELTTFSNEMLMNIMIIICRIAKLPIDDISRGGISQWIRSMFFYEHRKRNAIIPRASDLAIRNEGVKSDDAIIKDKKYRGAMVIEPQAGIHFDVTVMDFASLYPSIVKVRNISYETIRCIHEECKTNTIPYTNHWSCTKKNGVTSLLIGSLRDLRVSYYKALQKKAKTPAEKEHFNVVSQALKVILNAAYGVLGFESFPLYFLPAAESVTAVGRDIIVDTADYAKQQGMVILAGDTDSLFTKKPTPEQIKNLVSRTFDKYNIDIEIDKEYRYLVLSNRKKNYFGVKKDGKIDIKGLTGKKSHTPPIFKQLFKDLQDILLTVMEPTDFEKAKNEMRTKVSTCVNRLQNREIPLDDLSFKIMISKDTAEYTKTTPQHIKAARELEKYQPVKKGDIIQYVKVLGKVGVKPTKMATKDDIDQSKYMEFMESLIDQLISPMDLQFDWLAGKPMQVGLDNFL